MKNAFARLFALLTAAALAAGCLSGAVLAAENAKTVRVGIFVTPGYSQRDENGSWYGVDIEMIERIALTAGFRAEFVEVEETDEALQKLDSGAVDMLGSMAKTPERQQRWLYSDYEQGRVNTTLFVRQSDDRWDYGDVGQVKTMKICGERDYIACQYLIDWCSQYGFAPQLQYYDGAEAAHAALDSGAADALVEGENYIKGYRPVLSFTPTPYYLLFARGSVELKAAVDSAMAQIYAQDPLYESELIEKYVSQTRSAAASLTKSEKNYIAVSPLVRVAVLNDDAPYFSGSAERPQGVVPAFYEKIAAATGLRFAFEVFDTQAEALAAVKAGRADLVGIFSDGLSPACDAGLTLTRRYADTDAVLLTRAGTKTADVRRVAVKERYKTAAGRALSEELDGKQLVSLDTGRACFRELKAGAVDGVLIDAPSATYLINQTNPSDYALAPISALKLDMCGAVPADKRTLVSILNKGIDAASYSINGILAENTVTEKSVLTAVAKIPAGAVVVFGAVMVALVLVLIWAVVALLRSRRAKIEAVQTEAAAREQRIRAEEMNAFFSNISHDMRTPLNAILGYARMAEEQTTLDETRACVAQIEQSGKLLGDLVSDTLTISRLSGGKTPLQPAPVDTGELMRSFDSAVRIMAAQKGVAFAVDETGLRPRSVLADRTGLEKVFLNLLSNAVKFTPAGGRVSCTVRDDPAGAPDPDIVAVIEDDGIGMSAAYMEHMYEPFSQEKRPGCESVGTGLGLAIVREYVDRMGGTIDAESAPGRGTRFTVRLHLPETASVPAPAVPRGSACLRGKKALVCEDNPPNREIALDLLRGEGMTGVSAENGQRGLELFSQSAPGEFDVILMDLRMPVLDGVRAARAIRALNRPDAKTVPILALTADAFDDGVQKCLDAGMNGHVEKPVTAERLHAALVGCLKADEREVSADAHSGG